jgi:putative RecB family exonuclease
MDLPIAATLSPSRLNRFVSCPLAFRFAYIDRLEDPTTIHQFRGTVVHRSLQLLYRLEPAARTADAAHAAFDAAWADLGASDDARALELAGAAADKFVADGHRLVDKYLRLEDPTKVTAVGLELDLRATVGDIELRGIIDRLDRLPDGRFVVTDYKTGRSPRPDRSRSRLGGVLFYAYLCEATIGVRPSEVRLVYLADEVVVVEEPTDQAMRGLLQRAGAVWNAIERACVQQDFRPNPSTLCRFCAFQAHCPAFPAAFGEAVA